MTFVSFNFGNIFPKDINSFSGIIRSYVNSLFANFSPHVAL